jgi:hypothetical protein
MAAVPPTVPLASKPPKIFKSSAFAVRNDVISTTHDVVTTTTLLPTHNDRSIHFRLDRTSTKIINLSLLKLHLQFNIRDKSIPLGSDVKAYDSILIGHPLASLFKDVKIRLNGVLITESEGLYGYILNHLFMTKVPRHVRDAVTQSGKIYEDYEATKKMPDVDNPDKFTLAFNPSLWKDLDLRVEQYSVKNEKPIDLCTYLFTDVTVAPRPICIPPDVDVDIELIPTEPARSILTTRPGDSNPYVQISKAELIVPRIVAKAGMGRAIEHDFMFTRATPIIIPENRTNFHQIVSLTNSVPTRLTFMLCSMDSWNGTNAANMFNSYHHHLRSASFNVGGETHTVTPSDMNFDGDVTTELYLRTAEALRFSLNKTEVTLPPISEWAERRFSFSLDLSKDYSADSNWITPSEKGTISLDLRFDQPTESQLIGILVSESLGTIKLNPSGQVSLLTPE